MRDTIDSNGMTNSQPAQQFWELHRNCCEMRVPNLSVLRRRQPAAVSAESHDCCLWDSGGLGGEFDVANMKHDYGNAFMIASW